MGLFFCLFSIPIQAISFSDAAQHETWLRLGHYQAQGDSFKSDVLSPEFFLASKGRQSPQQELKATLAAFKQPFILNTADTHAICRFPARYFWLKSQGLINAPTDLSLACTSFKQWLKPYDLQSASLVLVTGYLGNPASTFGHVLLKINNRKKSYQTDLLNQAVNYGAIVPDGESGVLYTLYGLFGGYEATFSAKDVYQEIHVYLDKELRDMWEYELLLDEQQLRLMTAHIWELIGKKFDYYFIDENCSFRMSELLQLVFPQKNIAEPRLWNIPLSLFQTLKENNVIDEAELIPSFERVAMNLYGGLSAVEKTAFGDIVEHDKSDNYPLLNTEQRINVADASIQYYQYKIIKEPEEKLALTTLKNKWLLNRVIEPSKKINVTSQKTLLPPTQGHKPSLFRASMKHRKNQPSTLNAAFTVAHHDRLSLQNGKSKDTEFTALDVELVLQESKLTLEQFTFIKLTKYVTDQSDLFGNDKLSWHLNTAYLNQAMHNKKGVLVEGGMGKSYYFGSLLSYGFLIGSVFGESLNAIDADKKILLGAYYDWNSQLISQLEFDQRQHEPLRVNFLNRWLVNKDEEIRFDWFTNGSELERVNVSYLYYW